MALLSLIYREASIRKASLHYCSKAVKIRKYRLYNFANIASHDYNHHCHMNIQSDLSPHCFQRLSTDGRDEVTSRLNIKIVFFLDSVSRHAHLAIDIEYTISTTGFLVVSRWQCIEAGNRK